MSTHDASRLHLVGFGPKVICNLLRSYEAQDHALVDVLRDGLKHYKVECRCVSASKVRLPCWINPCDCAGRCSICGGRVGASAEYIP